MILEPKEFGLTPRTVVEQVGENTVAIVINRKSRIIMADGKKILEKIRKIKTVRPQATFALKTGAPVCGKTTAFLAGEGVQIIPI